MTSTSGPAAHPYTFGLEEEYFLVRRNGRRLRHMPRRFFTECRATLGERFGSEMLQTQAVVTVALAPLFLGLLVILPVLGHATWHLYARAAAES